MPYFEVLYAVQVKRVLEYTCSMVNEYKLVDSATLRRFAHFG